MSKILKIENDTVSIGLENGKIEEVRKADLNFNPKVGDQVEIFKTDSKTMVSKDNSADTSNVGKKPVNKIAYCLLAYFLGIFGVHKFYAGRTGTGILYIFLIPLAGLPALLGFIDFIVGLCKKADANGNIYV